MKMKSIIKKMRDGVDLVIKTFYHPQTYRDIVYREEGYGIKRVITVMLCLMMVSYSLIVIKAYDQYQHEEKEKILALPNLIVMNKKLNIYNQSLQSTNLINDKNFVWVADHQISQVSRKTSEQRIILGTRNLWLPFPKGDYFGYFFQGLGHYFPILSWSEFKGVINGHSIVSQMAALKFAIILLASSIPLYMINCLCVVLFIRSFAYIARNMVMLAMREALEYKLTCRLLAVAAIPSSVLMAGIINIFGIDEYTKFLFIFFYMLYFYLGLRFIKAKSYFRWLNA